MAYSKSELFSSENKELAAFAQALAHPARITIILLLQEKAEACCGELVRALPLAQPTISQHLRNLKKVGLLRERTCGTKICYSLNMERLRAFCHHFQCTLGTAEETEPVSSHCCE